MRSNQRALIDTRLLRAIAHISRPVTFPRQLHQTAITRPSPATRPRWTANGVWRPRTGFNTWPARRHETSSSQAAQEEKEKQRRTPWHREGSDVPPVKRPRSAGAMVKGKLLTTPSKLLKLIIPLNTMDYNTDRKDVEPLVLLVHPNQPLSYLERLIQSELPNIRNEKGEEKMPAVHFLAQNFFDDAVEARAVHEKKDDTAEDMYEDVDAKDTENDDPSIPADSPLHQQPNSASSSDSPLSSSSTTSQEEAPQRPLVRWSTSTEVGDFIRDAARAHEFALQIQTSSASSSSSSSSSKKSSEGEKGYNSVAIAVPSFNDRTHYLRQRLRKTASKIKDMAQLKRECDVLAHRGAQRVALAGAGVLVSYWYIVYRLTFETDLGWDTMEPVTYLVGLSTLILGYLWFLYHNREISYRSALNLTISRRQAQLYARKGFDNATWEALIEEANGYRREIKQIAHEYDVEWDERVDEKDREVTEAMRKDRKERASQSKGKDDDDDDSGGGGGGNSSSNSKKTS